MSCDCPHGRLEAGVVPAQLVFDGVHPEMAGNAEAANAWWQAILPASEWNLVLEQADDRIVAGFVAGAMEALLKPQDGSS